jgi:galactokinase
MKAVLESAFGPGGRVVVARAPGRVNLIGEHTDYNGGFVLPMAIEAGLQVAGRLRPGREVRLRAADYAANDAFSLDAPIARSQEHGWSNYPRGVLWALQQEGIEIPGLELAFGGDLPQGAGLSSSAALEVATALVVQALTGFAMERPRLALLCQRAENEFVGMRCGIMDQFVCLMGRAGHALFLDCRSLELQHVPLELGDHVMAICHSGVKHALVASEYNRRRGECGAGVAALRARFPAVESLRDATLEQLEACAPDMSDEVVRRCRHIITENARVLASAEALRRGDLARFGELMDGSHESQRRDFEVSCAEVDLLVDLARQVPGVLGARITGGGFGGCTVNLVAASALDALRRDALAEYQRKTGIAPRLFVSAPAAGAALLDEVER